MDVRSRVALTSTIEPYAGGMAAALHSTHQESTPRLIVVILTKVHGDASAGRVAGTDGLSPHEAFQHSTPRSGGCARTLHLKEENGMSYDQINTRPVEQPDIVRRTNVLDRRAG